MVIERRLVKDCCRKKSGLEWDSAIEKKRSDTTSIYLDLVESSKRLSHPLSCWDAPAPEYANKTNPCWCSSDSYAEGIPSRMLPQGKSCAVNTPACCLAASGEAV
ncbi:hypothetical protein EVAR_33369_1 [Eumeta japonica]|uniref:Uncharacterized protein n=1 Tax=Eumeta variegata TaxID=151549 RepID=A0A4C1X029_EUMVA|nr:hypothetical protein EVAR_33369_1 [Eumeta japonica]